jgi:hypothetical protein
MVNVKAFIDVLKLIWIIRQWVFGHPGFVYYDQDIKVVPAYALIIS